MQPLTSFITYIAGTDQPVGQWLCQYFHNSVATCLEFPLTATPVLQADNERKTFLVITPSYLHNFEPAPISAWLALAQEQQIPVILLSSLTVFSSAEDKLWQETDEQYSLTPHAQAILALEQQARANPKHIIVRAGLEFSLQHDYGDYLLRRLQTEPNLALNDSRFFSPTAADALADALHAIVQQLNCNDTLWGTYHCSGVEPVTSFQFAQALLTEARAYDDIDEITLSAVSEGGDSPQQWVPNGDNSQLFYTFGIRPKAWRRSLGRQLKGYFSA